MPDKTVLVTGATGLLGRQVVQAFEKADWTVKRTGYSRADGKSVFKVDLGSAAEIEHVLATVQPQAMIHCAANRFPDNFDKDPEGARNLNVVASKTLASLCAARGIFLIYLSTDYVFPGKPGDAPYETNAQPAPTNLYGQTKLDGEHAVVEEFRKAGRSGWGVVLRVPILYGDAETLSESAVNVLMDSVREAHKGVKITIDHWALRYPTNTEDVARVCREITSKYLEADDRSSLPQILHFTSEDKFTKYEICQVFGEIMGLSTTALEPNTEGNDPRASVQRPYDCHLSTRALKELGIDVSTQDFVDWWRRSVGALGK
ncbi:hypothetical protein AK830_g11158 [Neonectria ditissima]|uniref:RmlD-like substrate binding domain-containing protein n=1 Tax=Neonectria ditissima TaxID=78410 RepID=A0A0N8H577_9HYPO|nr:hypothetical protein AK830_g11158 [Neonectria ditissima]